MKENNQYLDNIQTLNDPIFSQKNYIVYPPKSERPSVRKSNTSNLNTNKFSTFKNNIARFSVKSYNGMTRPGKDASGSTKTNQDAYVCKENINNIQDFNIFGVSDGHGPDGHFVSEFVSEFIPSQIINNSEIINLTSTEKIYKNLKKINVK